MAQDWKKHVRQHLPPMRLGPEREIEIVAELAEHLQTAYEEALTRGASEEQARAQVRALFSDWRLLECELSSAEHSTSNTWRNQFNGDLIAHPRKQGKGALTMESLFKDLSYSLRVLLKSPGVTLIAVIALALGIGANSAIFSVVNALVLRPLPFPELDRLVAAYEHVRTGGNDHHELTVANYLDLRAQNQTFDHLALYRWWSVNLTGTGQPERLQGYLVTANLLDALGMKPALGRNFFPDEDQAGKPKSVILTHGLWQRRFGGDAHILGKTIGLNGVPHTVAGVMPPEFNYPKGAELIAPLEFTPPLSANRGSHSYLSVGRLKPGITIQQAQDDLSAIARRLEEQYPNDNTGRGMKVYPLLADTVRMYKVAALVLMAAVGFVLLIACANVANLLLARAASRFKEVAIRAAVGASRWRIIQQLLTESIVLAVIGGVLGIVFAIWGVSALKAAMPAEVFQFVPGMNNIAVNYQVLGFTLALSVLTGILFGIAPAIQASKPDLNETLKEGGGKAPSGGKRHRLLNGLVVVEIALSLVLLVGAGVMMKSFLNLLKTDPGFQGDNVLTMNLLLPRAKYPEISRQVAFYQELLERVSHLPGIESAAIVNYLPLGMSNSSNSILIEGQPAPPPGQEIDGRYRVCSPLYFETMGIPLLKGRSFTEQDTARTLPVMIVNETLAKRFWPAEDPIGKRIRFTGNPEQNPWRQIVGVIADVRHDLNSPVQPEYYLPHAQDTWNSMVLVARTSAEPTALAAPIRNEVLNIDRDQPVFDIRTMRQVRERATVIHSFSVSLLSIFATMALLLAALGIYGVMSYQVSQRTHEIGVRLALGAKTSDVLKMVVRQGMTLAAAGMSIGLVGAVGITQALKAVLAEIGVADLSTFAMVSLLLLAVAFVACVIPAFRATKVDPLVALRYE